MKINLLHKVGIIGFGNMGSVIAHKLAGQPDEYEVWVYDKDKGKTINARYIKSAVNLDELVSKSETIIIAVKPQDFDHLIKELKGRASNKLIISIAAGISTKNIEKHLSNSRVIRVMPNIAARIAESVTCISKGNSASDDDLEFAREVFNFLGTVRSINEDMMNAATAISGSGPGYVFYFIENSAMDPDNISEYARHDMMRRLERAAEVLGFKEEDASFLAANTVNASVSLLKSTRISPAELREQVASKGGTTEAALEVLRKGGSWEDAAQAALKRAGELARRD